MKDLISFSSSNGKNPTERRCYNIAKKENTKVGSKENRSHTSAPFLLSLEFKGATFFCFEDEEEETPCFLSLATMSVSPKTLVERERERR